MNLQDAVKAVEDHEKRLKLLEAKLEINATDQEGD